MQRLNTQRYNVSYMLQPYRISGWPRNVLLPAALPLRSYELTTVLAPTAEASLVPYNCVTIVRSYFQLFSMGFMSDALRLYCRVTCRITSELPLTRFSSPLDRCVCDVHERDVRMQGRSSAWRPLCVCSPSDKQCHIYSSLVISSPCREMPSCLRLCRWRCAL